jgi:hypothetical protein
MAQYRYYLQHYIFDNLYRIHCNMYWKHTPIALRQDELKYADLNLEALTNSTHVIIQSSLCWRIYLTRKNMMPVLFSFEAYHKSLNPWYKYSPVNSHDPENWGFRNEFFSYDTAYAYLVALVNYPPHLAMVGAAVIQPRSTLKELVSV